MHWIYILFFWIVPLLASKDNDFRDLLESLEYEDDPHSFYQITRANLHFLDFLIEGASHGKQFQKVFDLGVADYTWVERVLSNPKFLDWTAGAPHRGFNMGLDDFRLHVLPRYKNFKIGDPMSIFLTDSILRHIPLMSKNENYGSVVELLETMKHYLEVEGDLPPIYPFSVLTRELKESWPEESLTDLINECITKNDVNLFKTLAPSSASEIEDVLRDWAYAPERTSDRSPGPLFKYIFQRYKLSEAFGSEFLGISIVRDWKPMLDFLIQHSAYHQGLNGLFLVDALKNNRISSYVKRTLLKSDLIKDIPSDAWDSVLVWSTRNSDLSMFASVVSSGLGEHSGEVVREVYRSIPEKDIDRSAKILVLVTGILSKDVTLFQEDWELFFTDSILEQNCDVTVLLLKDARSRSAISPKVYEEYMGYYMDFVSMGQVSSLRLIDLLTTREMMPIAQSVFPFIDWSNHLDTPPSFERPEKGPDFPKPLQALPSQKRIGRTQQLPRHAIGRHLFRAPVAKSFSPGRMIPRLPL
jgi:hypothetical protein